MDSQQLDDLFDMWLFTGEKPPPEAVSGARQAARSGSDAATDGWFDDPRRRLRVGRY